MHNLQCIEKWIRGLKCWFVIFGLVFVIIGVVLPVKAEVVYQNANGYEVVFEDTAQLLSASEAKWLQKKMEVITEYGNVGFKTISTNSMTADAFADRYYAEKWGRESGTLFLIDMDNRIIYIKNNGYVSSVITSGRCDTITDNVYRYATNGDYYSCAAQAYEQIHTLLEGGRIAQPMKYTSNALLAIILSFILLYCVVLGFSKANQPSERELLDNLAVERRINNYDVIFTHESRKYSPRSSGGGRGGSGGGGSGGGHSF